MQPEWTCSQEKNESAHCIQNITESLHYIFAYILYILYIYIIYIIYIYYRLYILYIYIIYYIYILYIYIIDYIYYIYILYIIYIYYIYILYIFLYILCACLLTHEYTTQHIPWITINLILSEQCSRKGHRSDNAAGVYLKRRLAKG